MSLVFFLISSLKTRDDNISNDKHERSKFQEVFNSFDPTRLP